MLRRRAAADDGAGARSADSDHDGVKGAARTSPLLLALVATALAAPVAYVMVGGGSSAGGGGGGADGGGDGSGGGDGGGGDGGGNDGGNLLRAPQSVQSVPRAH